MYTRLLSRSLNAHTKALGITNAKCLLSRRTISTDAEERKSKYMEKLHQKAEETGLSVTQLLEKAKADEAERRKAEAEKLKSAAAAFQKPSNAQASLPKTENVPSARLTERKDAPPFRPLSSILNLPRILSAPHTADQISALWTAYHASRSGGTGRGYVCASVPLDQFHKLEKNGKLYPSFVVPVPHIQAELTTAGFLPPEEEMAHEFYYLQWDFHASPPIPSPSDDPFAKPVQSLPEGSNPPSCTILFTPLQEYKSRGSFATPYLVLTLYTDLAASHGVVLLRGEITPSTSNGHGTADRYMLNQSDAQVLTLALQKFYLWNEGKDSGQPSEGERLLRAFHETPQDFKWEELLKFSKLTI
ncbi:ATP11 protein-domain-containing protein [Flammula alnicola]|nr:ATP11 protein-domain-containing protein [Flammula alnicola]